MRVRAIVATLLLCALLSGCSSAPKGPTTGATTSASLAPDRGAIKGLLIDDIYRPIPGALVLLQGAGLTATTDDLGQFNFDDLQPGTYVALANAAKHEAAPVNVDVHAGEYTDLEVQARRIFSQDGQILTQQYSVFEDCSFEALAVSETGQSCTNDLSGDSSRTGFTTDLRSEAANLTYMVTEVKFNQKSDYSVDIGLADDTGLYTTYYAEADVVGADYVKITNQLGGIDSTPAENVGSRNVNFTLDPPFLTTIFPHGSGYSTLHTVCAPETPATNADCLWGAGVVLAVKADIVQSVFLGPPAVDLAAYHVLGPSAPS